jgi:hypothetical protein
MFSNRAQHRCFSRFLVLVKEVTYTIKRARESQAIINEWLTMFCEQF